MKRLAEVSNRRRLKGELACKPGSVEDSHSSRSCVTTALQQPTRKHAGPTLHQGLATSDDFPIWPCSRWGLPCRPCCHVRGALLPHRFTLASTPCGRFGGLFSVALSVGSRPQALPGTLSTGARTFLPAMPCDTTRRLPGQLPARTLSGSGLHAIALFQRGGGGRGHLLEQRARRGGLGACAHTPPENTVMVWMASGNGPSTAMPGRFISSESCWKPSADATIGRPACPLARRAAAPRCAAGSPRGFPSA